jgi:hypothetical protein
MKAHRGMVIIKEARTGDASIIGDPALDQAPIQTSHVVIVLVGETTNSSEQRQWRYCPRVTERHIHLEIEK